MRPGDPLQLRSAIFEELDRIDQTEDQRRANTQVIHNASICVPFDPLFHAHLLNGTDGLADKIGKERFTAEFIVFIEHADGTDPIPISVIDSKLGQHGVFI